MYWILNCLPLLIECVVNIYSIFQKFYNLGFYSSEYIYEHTSTIIMFLEILILSPIYLLCINFIYINKKLVTYKMSIICMISVIIVRVAIMMLSHKIKWGTFIGDVPMDIYYIFIIVPSVIVGLGIVIYYFVKTNNE